ncbi:Tat pathway signal protein [Atopobiaceae bacterium 24-176]
MASTQRRPTPRRAGSPTGDRSARPAARPRPTSNRSAHRSRNAAPPRPLGPAGPAAPRPIDRRALIKGAAGVGAVAVVGGALSSIQGCSAKSSDDAPASAPVVVDDGSATSVLDTYTAADAAPGLAQTGAWTLPLGTVLTPSEGEWIACTLTGENANPPVSAGAFSLASGTAQTVVDKPRSQGATYVVYEARCSDSVYAWVELDSVSGSWTLYGSAFSGGALTGEPVELYSADAEWEPPAVACSGNAVVWLVMPVAAGSKSAQDSTCCLWRVGQSKASVVVTSHGRFACEPTISDGVVTLVPRVREDEGLYYGITGYDLASDLSKQVDQLVLPLSVRPFSAVRMGERFVFQIEANYQSGGLLGKMGTYVSQKDGTFVTVAREPLAAPAGKGDVVIVKVRASYVVADLANASYGTLAAEDRSVDYGEYPARVGTCDTFVTFCTVKDPSTGYPSAVSVRAFSVA